jgi:hypothetical protein
VVKSEVVLWPVEEASGTHRTENWGASEPVWTLWIKLCSQWTISKPRHYITWAVSAPSALELASFPPDLLSFWSFSKWLPLWSSGQNSWIQNGDVLCFLWGTNWTYIQN